MHMICFSNETNTFMICFLFTWYAEKKSRRFWKRFRIRDEKMWNHPDVFWRVIVFIYREDSEVLIWNNLKKKKKKKRQKIPGYMGVLLTAIRFPLRQNWGWREQNSCPLRNERGRKNHYNLGNCFFPFLSLTW